MVFQTMRLPDPDADHDGGGPRPRRRQFMSVSEACQRERRRALLAFARWGDFDMWSRLVNTPAAFRSAAHAIARRVDLGPCYPDMDTTLRVSVFPSHASWLRLHPVPGPRSGGLHLRQLAIFDELLAVRVPVPMAVHFAARHLYSRRMDSSEYNLWTPAAAARDERRALRERVWTLAYPDVPDATVMWDRLRLLRGPAASVSVASQHACRGAYTLTIESHAPVAADSEAVFACIASDMQDQRTGVHDDAVQEWIAGGRRRRSEQVHLIATIRRIGAV